MLEHLSPKFKMPPMEREPRAALILNRFTRNLTIMYATDAVTQILGLTPAELVERPFYECIQPNCVEEAEQCLERAKENESIAYLRFWYKDPRIELNNPRVREEEEEDEDEEEEEEEEESDDEEDNEIEMTDEETKRPDSDSDMDLDDPSPRRRRNSVENLDPLSRPANSSAVLRRRRPVAPPPQTFELEAVVSCTSDGLVVVLRRARPPIPDPEPPVPPPPPFNYENGLFAAPWGVQPYEPYFPPETLYTFRPPLLPQYMPLRECVKAAGGPPLERMLQ